MGDIIRGNVGLCQDRVAGHEFGIAPAGVVIEKDTITKVSLRNMPGGGRCGEARSERMEAKDELAGRYEV